MTPQQDSAPAYGLRIGLEALSQATSSWTRPDVPPSLCHMQGFNNTRHDYEITLENQSQIEVVPEDPESAAIPQIQYHVRFALQNN